MRRIDGKRREKRKNLAQEVILKPDLFLFADIRSINKDYAIFSESVPELAPTLLLIARQQAHGLADARELLGRGEPIRTLDADARPQQPFQAGHTDHEELVQIVRRDRQKPHTLQQRMRFIHGFLEHPTVELQPRQLAIDKALRARRQLEGRHRRRRDVRTWRQTRFLLV